MGIFVISIIIIIIGLLFLFSKSMGGNLLQAFGMKQSAGNIFTFILVFAGAVMLIYSLLFTVDEGEAVVLIQFGKLYDTVDTPGVHAKRPWANVHVYPKRIREHTMLIEVRTADGMGVQVDTTTWYKVDTQSIDNIYRNIAADVTSLEDKIIFPALRTTIRNTVSQYNVKELYESRNSLFSIMFFSEILSCLRILRLPCR
jgi:regulator of protease activity HflC (stomatin/prohibitin superfamily)